MNHTPFRRHALTLAMLAAVASLAQAQQANARPSPMTAGCRR